MVNLAVDFTVENQLPGTAFAWTIYRDVSVTQSSENLKQAVEDELKRIKARFTLETLYEDPGVTESRRSFKALGLDPSRYRPAQEALLCAWFIFAPGGTRKNLWTWPKRFCGFMEG